MSDQSENAMQYAVHQLLTHIQRKNAVIGCLVVAMEKAECPLRHEPVATKSGNDKSPVPLPRPTLDRLISRWQQIGGDLPSTGRVNGQQLLVG